MNMLLFYKQDVQSGNRYLPGWIDDDVMRG